MTAKDFLKRMPALLDPEAAGETQAVIQYEISEPVYQVLEQGQLTVHDGQADAPDLIITMADEDLVKLFTGELNGMTAFMSGKVKLQGDMMLAQRLVGFVDREKMQSLT
jgi:putative sterol carrier protein